MIQPNRRSLLGGLACLIASPAIVRASNLMPAKVLAPSPPQYLTIESLLDARIKLAYEQTINAMTANLYKNPFNGYYNVSI